MKLFKKVLAGVAVATAFAMPAFAANVTVGGVTWDPDFIDGGDQDFGAAFNYTQWYSSTSSVGGTIAAGSYTNAITLGAVTTDLANGGSFGNYYLQGAGEVTVINGSTTFAGSNELTYSFGGLKLNADGTVDSSNGWAKLRLNSTTPNLTVGISNEAEVADAQSGSLWLELSLSGITLQLSSNLEAGSALGFMTAIAGDAFANFDPKNLTYSSSASFQNGGNSKWSGNANGQVTGNSIPEPESLALVGLGLLGLAAARRRKIAK